MYIYSAETNDGFGSTGVQIIRKVKKEDEVQ